MPLDYQIDEATFKTIDENHQGFYKKTDAGYILDVNGAVNANDLKNANEKLLNTIREKEKFENTFKSLGEYSDPDKIKALTTKLTQLEVQLKNNGGGELTKEQIEQITKPYQLELDKIKNDITEKDSVISKMSKETLNMKLINSVRDAIPVNKLSSNAVYEDIIMHARNDLKYNEDTGKFEDGVKNNIQDWFKNKTTLNGKSYWLKGHQSPVLDAAGNPITKKTRTIEDDIQARWKKK